MDKAVALSFQSSEGIDTVSIEIFSDFVNTEKWLNGRQISAGISLEVRVSKFKNYYFCHIQTENLRWNILSCVLKIAEKLCKAEYIILNAKDDLFRFIFINRHNIMRLAELDFYFDFTRKELQMGLSKKNWTAPIILNLQENSNMLKFKYEQRRKR